MEREIAEYTKIGLKNRETLRLIEQHCTHARVELIGGVGLLEETTGLPIAPRSVRCSYATIPGPASMKLEGAAVEFYKANCIACSQRSMVGIPNLATRAAELDREREAREARHAARQKVAEEARARRRERRDRLATGEPYATAALIRSLDAIDKEQPDEEGGRKLVETARAAPSLFTPSAIDALTEIADANPTPHVLNILRSLARAGQVDPERAVAIALAVLAKGPSNEAAAFLVEFEGRIRPGMLGLTRRALIHLAGRHGPWDAPANPAPLLAATRIDLAGVLETLEEMLGSDSEGDQANAASAAESVIQAEPGIAPVLSERLTTVIRESEYSLIDNTPSAARAAAHALSVALIARPTEVSRLLEAKAPDLVEKAREMLFRAYDGIMRGRRERAVPEDAGATTVDACIRRLSGDWGGEVARDAADTLEMVARYAPDLLVPRAGDLFGWLIAQANQSAEKQSPLTDPSPAPLRAIERMSERIRREATVHRIQETIGLLAKGSPKEVGRHILGLLDGPELDSDGGRELRATMVRLLGPLGAHPRMLGPVLPRFYSALVASDQILRAAAIEAWETISGSKTHRLPSTLDDLVLPLLSDPYVMVHTRMVRAITSIGVRDEDAEKAVQVLLVIANEGADGSGRNTSEALGAVLRLSSRLPRERRIAYLFAVLKIADKLGRSELRGFLVSSERMLGPLRQSSAFMHLILKVLVDPKQRFEFEHDRGEDRILGLLAGTRSELVRAEAAAICTAAMIYLPEYPYPTIAYVEILQKAAAWREASDLAEEICSRIPGTTEHEPRRRVAGLASASANLELTLARAEDPEAVEKAIQRLEEALRGFAKEGGGA